MSDSRLIALRYPNRTMAARLTELWDDGFAVLPLSPSLSGAEMIFVTTGLGGGTGTGAAPVIGIPARPFFGADKMIKFSLSSIRGLIVLITVLGSAATLSAAEPAFRPRPSDFARPDRASE